MVVTPPYMKTKVSAGFIRDNPKYKKLFLKCPNCGKLALKPIERVADPSRLGERVDRKCTVCGYISKA